MQRWGEVLNAGTFAIAQLRPYPHFEAKFPQLGEKIPWNPAAAKVNREPEEFRQIWLNPEEDIPFVLEALKRLEFIDENEVWRVGQYSNPLGPIVALINFPDRSFFGKLDRSVISTAFCNRFKIKQPKKGFKVQHGPFQNSKEKMERYLTKNS